MQCALTPFRASNAQSKVRVKYIEALKHQERLKEIKKDTKDQFIGSKTLRKTKLMYLAAKLKEAKFN